MRVYMGAYTRKRTRRHVPRRRRCRSAASPPRGDLLQHLTAWTARRLLPDGGLRDPKAALQGARASCPKCLQSCKKLPKSLVVPKKALTFAAERGKPLPSDTTKWNK